MNFTEPLRLIKLENILYLLELLVSFHKRIVDKIPNKNQTCEKCSIQLSSSNYKGIKMFVSTSPVNFRTSYCIKCALIKPKRLGLRYSVTIQDLEKFLALNKSDQPFKNSKNQPMVI